MKKLLNCFKKNKIKAFVGLLVILVLYAFFVVFDPNYVEFGPGVSFYKSKDCVSTQCLIYGSSVSTYRTNPVTLYKAVDYALHSCGGSLTQCLQGKGMNLPPQYSTNPNLWECSLDGKVISDPKNTKTILGKNYACWPK